jgi:hypothetical protein
LLRTAASLRDLRCLSLCISELPLPLDKGLGQLTGLTSLTLNHTDMTGPEWESWERCYQPWARCGAWAREIGCLTCLTYLSVPGQLVVVKEPWLCGLQQLQVLMLDGLEWPPGGPEGETVLGQVVGWLEECNMAVLPAGLRLLMFEARGQMEIDATAVGLPGRLQRLMGSRECEVVAGPYLEALFDVIYIPFE